MSQKIEFEINKQEYELFSFLKEHIDSEPFSNEACQKMDLGGFIRILAGSKAMEIMKENSGLE